MDVEHLRGGLVVTSCSNSRRRSRDDRSLVGGEQDGGGTDRVDPDAVVVVPARRAAKGGEGLAAVSGLPGHHAGRVHDVRIERTSTFHFGKSVGRSATAGRHRMRDQGLCRRRAEAGRRNANPPRSARGEQGASCAKAPNACIPIRPNPSCSKDPAAPVGEGFQVVPPSGSTVEAG